MSVESRTMEMVGLLNDTLSWLDMYLSVVSSTMLIGVISDLWHYCHIKMKSITQQIPLGYYSFTENSDLLPSPTSSLASLLQPS